MDRRAYLTTAAVTAGLAIAGCTGSGDREDQSVDGVDDSEDVGEEAVEGEQDDEDADETDEGENTEDETDEEDGDDGDEDEDENEEAENHPSIVGPFDDFEDEGPWQEFLGSMSVDTERSAIGSQSVVMEPNERGTARIRRELDEPIDTSEVAPGLATTADGPGWALIQLQDPDGNYHEYGQYMPGGTPMVRKNFGLTRVRGDPDPDRVTLIQFVRWYAGSASRFWVDDLHFVPEPDRGKVALCFRGGHESHRQQALSILREHGITGTALVPTEAIGGGGATMSPAQVDDLAQAGWTIGGYGARGRRLTGLGDGQLDREVVQSAAWLDERGHEGPRVFAFPDAQYDADSYELVRNHYDIAFAERSRSQGYAANPHLWTAAESPTDPEEATELVDWAADIGGITTIPFEGLGGESLAALEATLDRIDERVAAGELDVVTPAEMANQYVFQE